MNSNEPLHRRDVLILIGYCVVLFGIAVVSGRPLTLHECVLPQTSRSMFADHDFVIPKMNGHRADARAAAMPIEVWVENPPLPQWITVALALPFGRCDTEGIVRIGPMLVGIGVVLLTAWMASLWFGRAMGLLAGLVQATTLEFTRYSWLAEDEIYLCGVITCAVALFVKIEFGMGSKEKTLHENQSWAGWILTTLFGRRSRWVVAFFAALGATNLVKGMIFGTVLVSVPIAGFLCLTFEVNRTAKYVWVWGGLLFLAVMCAWPLAAYSRYPDAVDVWFFDLFGRLSGTYREMNAPLWYYPVNMLWMLLPWTFVVPLGLLATGHAAWLDRTSPERFLWCWALLVPAFLSIPGGKHHHYLLHALVPWAILAAIGIRELRSLALSRPRWLTHPFVNALGYGVPAIIALAIFGTKVPGPNWIPWLLMAVVPVTAAALAWSVRDRQAVRAGAIAFATLLVCYCGGHCYSAQYLDSNRQDVAFLKSTRQRVETEKLPILVDMSANPFHGMMGLFYMPDEALLLHNLTFLGAAEIPSSEVFVIAIGSLKDEIERWGRVEVVETSLRIPRGSSAKDRLTLFRLRFDDNITRVAASQVRVAPLQSQHRRPGPFLTNDTAGRDPQADVQVLRN